MEDEIEQLRYQLKRTNQEIHNVELRIKKLAMQKKAFTLSDIKHDNKKVKCNT